MSTKFGVTPTGFVVKRLADIIASLKASLQTVKDPFGNTLSIDAEDSTLISQIINIVAEEFSEGWSVVGALATQFDPAYNTGPFQSGTVQLNGIFREKGIATEIALSVGGVGGTIIPAGAGIGYNGSAFAINSPITIGAAAIATGWAAVLSTAPVDGDTIQIGNITYTFKTTTMTNPFSVRREPVGSVTAAGCITALIKAVNATGTPGTDYGTGTYPNPLVTASINANPLYAILTAIPTGSNGNSVALVSMQASVSVSGATLLGGTAYGTGTGFATATSNLSPVAVPNGSALTITTPVNGWISALAATPAIIVAGTAEESDEALRIRQQISTQIVASREAESILDAVQNVAGVTWAQVYENPSLTTTDGNGIPPGSICVVVIGGTALGIANAIYPKLSCATLTYGTSSYMVNGLPVYFLIPAPSAVTVNVNVMPSGAALPVGYAASIATAITAWGNANYIPGQTVYASDMYQALAGNIAGMYATSVSIGIPATGTITFSQQPAVAATLTIGGKVYRFESTMAAAGDVQIGSTFALTMANLMLAINGTGVAGTTAGGANYYTGTLPCATAGITATNTTTALTVTARMAGTNGNSIVLSVAGTTPPAVTGSGFLTGGAITTSGESLSIAFGYIPLFATTTVNVNNI